MFVPRRVNQQEVYVDNQRFGRRFFPPALVRHPQPCMFPAKKEPQTCRIFVLGESAAMGDPDPSFGFSRLLDVLLRERYPDIKFEVVNPSITAINSHVVVPMARDCARHQGDIWVVYMGNNEVVGPYGAGTVFGSKTPPLWMIRCSIALKSTRLGQVIQQVWRRGTSANDAPKTWGGMEMFLGQQVTREDARLQRVHDYFGRNLEGIIQLGRGQDCKVVVSTLANNLRNCAPFASIHQQGLSAEQVKAWEEAYRGGLDLEKSGNNSEALAQYQRARQIDSGYADLDYHIGRCQLALGQVAEARKSFESARDLDTLRFRPDTTINRIIREKARGREREGVYLVDGEKEIAARSPLGIAGDDLLYEHVHPTFEGNYWLARLVAEQVAQILPGIISSKSSSSREWASQEDCRQFLAHTDWDEFQSVEVMWKRMQDAPFTHQSDWAERNQRWKSRLEELQPRTKAYALRRSLELYRQALSRAPGDWQLRANFARILQASGEEKESMNQWQALLRQMPHHPQGLYSLGHGFDTLGQGGQAKACFQEALRVRPEFHEALNGLGLVLVNEGKYPEAIQCYRRALQINPEFAEGYINLGLVYSSLGHTNQAITEYEKALQVKPGSAAAHINLGKLMSSQRRLNEALDHYSKAVQSLPEDPIARYNLANVLVSLGRPEEAFASYAEAVRLRPNFTEARLNWGLELARIGRNAEATIQFREAARQSPDNFDAHFNLGVALAQQQRFQEAVTHFKEALRISPGHIQAQKSLEAAQALMARSKN